MEEYYEVRHYLTNEIIHCGEDESFKKFIEQAVKNDVNLAYADLSYADLSGLNLRYAIIRSAKLEGANLNNTDLTHVCLYDAILYDAKFRGANLTNTDFAFSYLSDADFTGAIMYEEDFEKLKDKLTDEQKQQISVQKITNKEE